MKERRFDAIVAGVTAMWTRRGMVGFLVGATGGSLAGLLRVVQAAPGERKRKRHRRRERRRRKLAGTALYPDLRTLPPSQLRFDEIEGQHVLRFTNTVWNAGEGRLELQAPTSPTGGETEQLYQNLYDAPVGGTRVARRPVNGRIFYHENHAHYHFADFATYLVLRRNAAGDEVIGHGTKTSFCIVDSTRVQGYLSREYDKCERERQGLTSGWGDTYDWWFDEQWVVLEDGPLTEGEYAVQSIADPKSLLTEGGGQREDSNSALVYFTVDENGDIINERGIP